MDVLLQSLLASSMPTTFRSVRLRRLLADELVVVAVLVAVVDVGVVDGSGAASHGALDDLAARQFKSVSLVCKASS